MRRLVAVLALVVGGALGTVALAFFGGTGSGSAPFTVAALASGGTCPSGADAATLPPGSSATASLDCSTDQTIHIGVPKGADGANGAKGDTGAASTVPGPAGPTGPAGADSTVPGPAGQPGSPGTDCAGLAPTSPARTCPGAQGAQGDAGATGAQGPAGPAGANGVSGYEVQTGTCTTTSSCSASTTPCTPGKKVISVNFSESIFVPNRIVTSSGIDLVNQRGQASMAGGTASSTLTVTAICVTAP